MEKANCILLVDDNQTTTFLHQQLINKLNLADKILIARNGRLALEMIDQYYAAEKEYPELILLDIKMPVMDGFEFFKNFQQLAPEKRNAMKVVILTTSLISKDLERAKEIGIEHYINKPLTAQKLYDIWPNHIKNLQTD